MMIRALRPILFIVLSSLIAPIYALNWADLWKTKDQQAQAMMQKKQFKEAQNTFKRDDWEGVAAYRAGDYKQAVESFARLRGEQAYYNQGNALAHLGEYEKAIAAYDQAIAINPKNQDAVFNRNLLKELMKKDKQKQQNKNQQNQDQQKQDQQNKKQQSQDQKNQDQQDKKQQNQDQQDKNQQNQDQKNKEQRNSQQKENKQNKDQKKNKQQQDQKEKQERSQQEEQAAKQQWLKLVPDDPGGLMRQKFLRDYLKRQGGWY